MTRLFLAVPIRLYNYEEIKKSFGPLLEGRWRDEKSLHVTLIRVKKITDEDLFLKKLETSQAKTIGILESKIALYQSYLHSDGARYEVLQEWHT